MKKKIQGFKYHDKFSFISNTNQIVEIIAKAWNIAKEIHRIGTIILLLIKYVVQDWT